MLTNKGNWRKRKVVKTANCPFSNAAKLNDGSKPVKMQMTLKIKIMRIEVVFDKITIVDFPDEYKHNPEFIRLVNKCLMLRKEMLYYNKVKNNSSLAEYALKEIKSAGLKELTDKLKFVEIEQCFKKHLNAYRKLMIGIGYNPIR